VKENTTKPLLNPFKKKEADLPLDILSKIITISA
jgi:predicted membrane chloride channel (bestrophin family)